MRVVVDNVRKVICTQAMQSEDTWSASAAAIVALASAFKLGGPVHFEVGLAHS